MEQPKLSVHVQELDSGFIVEFVSTVPGKTGKSHACSEIGQALDIIMGVHEGNQPVTDNVSAVVTTQEYNDGKV